MGSRLRGSTELRRSPPQCSNAWGRIWRLKLPSRPDPQIAHAQTNRVECDGTHGHSLLEYKNAGIRAAIAAESGLSSGSRTVSFCRGFRAMDSDADSDAVNRQLLARACAGDREALGELLENNRDYLRNLADRLLDDRMGRRIDASDVVQQTCLSVHKQIGEFVGQDAAQFAAWLRQIHERNIRNAVRDQLHTEKRAISREERLPDGDAHAIRQTTPSQHVVRREESAKLAKAIGQLVEDEGEALRRRYLEGQSVAEIAAAMGLSKDALARLFKRAMKNVKRHLRDDL